MSRPDTCPAQPTTDQDDRGDTYKGRTRGPVYSDKRSGVSKRPRRPLPAGGDVPEVRTTPGRIGRPRRPLPAGGDVPEVRTTPAGSDIRGDTYLLREAPAGGFHRTGKTGCPSVQMNSRQQVTPIKEDRAYHYRRSAPMEFSIRVCCQGTKKEAVR